jgi:hypothetical protein
LAAITICTAAAPDGFFTIRRYAIGLLDDPRRSCHADGCSPA